MYGGMERCMIRLVYVWRELPNKNFVIRKRIRWRGSEIGSDSGRVGEGQGWMSLTELFGYFYCC